MGQAADEMSAWRADAADAQDLDDDVDSVTPDTAAVEQEIEQTRAEMSGTIDAIQERLNPDHLKDQAREMVRDATIGRAQDMVNDATETAKDAGMSVVDTIKQNPLPAALAGVGIGWLWMKRSKGGQQTTYGYDYRYQSAGRPMGYDRGPGFYGNRNPYGAQTQYYSPYGDQSAQQYGQQGGQDQGSKLGQAAGAVGETASNLAGGAADQVGNLASGAAHVASGAAQQVEQLPGMVQSQAQRATYKYEQLLYEQPFAAGLLAVAAGAALGMLLPETQKEQQLMGDARDSVVEKAQSAAQETMGRVQDRVQDVVETVQGELQSSAQS